MVNNNGTGKLLMYPICPNFHHFSPSSNWVNWWKSIVIYKFALIDCEVWRKMNESKWQWQGFTGRTRIQIGADECVLQQNCLRWINFMIKRQVVACESIIFGIIKGNKWQVFKNMEVVNQNLGRYVPPRFSKIGFLARNWDLQNNLLQYLCLRSWNLAKISKNWSWKCKIFFFFKIWKWGLWSWERAWKSGSPELKSGLKKRGHEGSTSLYHLPMWVPPHLPRFCGTPSI